jgi:hypothetical protein
MNNFILWLFSSSADPNKIALTVKGFLLGIIPLVIMGLRVFNITPLPQDLESVAIDVSGLVAIVLTGVGLVRKIYLTFKK